MALTPIFYPKKKSFSLAPHIWPKKDTLYTTIPYHSNNNIFIVKDGLYHLAILIKATIYCLQTTGKITHPNTTFNSRPSCRKVRFRSSSHDQPPIFQLCIQCNSNLETLQFDSSPHSFTPGNSLFPFPHFQIHCDMSKFPLPKFRVI